MLASWLLRKIIKRLLIQLENTGQAAHHDVMILSYSDGTFYIGVGNRSGYCCLGEVPACYEVDSANSLPRAIRLVESEMEKASTTKS